MKGTLKRATAGRAVGFFTLVLAKMAVGKSTPKKPGVMLNYDKDENLVSVQVSKASQRSLWHSGRVIYDPPTDTLTIILSRKPVADSDEETPGVILDYDAVGNLVSLEILDASRRVQYPDQIARDFALHRQRFRYSRFKRK